MYIKKIALALLLVCGSTHFINADPSHERPTIAPNQIETAFNKVNEAIMPHYKKIYKKFYNEIEWVKHNYIINRVKGDEILDKVAAEFMTVLEGQIDTIIESAIKGFLPKDISAKEMTALKEEMKMVMLQVLPVTIIQGLKSNAEMESEIYQEILKERKEETRKRNS